MNPTFIVSSPCCAKRAFIKYCKERRKALKRLFAPKARRGFCRAPLRLHRNRQSLLQRIPTMDMPEKASRVSKPRDWKLIVEKDVQVPMRDGSILYADIFRPDTSEKVPVIL